MEVRALTWNLYHGRDAPPEKELRTWRSRILRVTERGAAHAQVNRDLRDGFTRLLAGAEWDVALLQECPPRWAEALAVACAAEPHLVRTARNVPRLGALQGLAADLNPDLIASWEGGSNLTLVRSPGRGRAAIAERRMLRLASRPERRTMAFTRLGSGLCVGNLHASGPTPLAEHDVELAARTAREWAGAAPLLLGGDLNLSPHRSPPVFARLAGEHGLGVPTSETAIDHLLVHGLEILDPPQAWPREGREVPDPTAKPGSGPLPVVLSDHAPVEARFALAAPRRTSVR